MPFAIEHVAAEYSGRARLTCEDMVMAGRHDWGMIGCHGPVLIYTAIRRILVKGATPASGAVTRHDTGPPR
jgi:hypothetical protein